MTYISFLVWVHKGTTSSLIKLKRKLFKVLKLFKTLKLINSP